MGNLILVTEMNKTRLFKFHPGNWAGVFIWENSTDWYNNIPDLIGHMSINFTVKLYVGGFVQHMSVKHSVNG